MVTILISTYNGSHYIDQQISSIINQDIGFNNIKLLIRDDNSKDNTYDILENYSNEYKNIKVIHGENLGPAYSFWNVLEVADLDSEFYAFSDQDDIWECDKISSAIKFMGNTQQPVLYYSNAMFADKDGNSLEKYVISKENHMSVPTVMAGMPALGCTMVFNNAAMQIFKKVRLSGIEMHDRTCFLIMYLIGNIIYDNSSHIKYRQHDNNVIGCGEKQDIKRFIKRKKQSFQLWFKSSKHNATVQASDMLYNFESILRDNDKKYLKMIASYRHHPMIKIKLICDKNIKMISKGTRRSYRLRILLNLF